MLSKSSLFWERYPSLFNMLMFLKPVEVASLPEGFMTGNLSGDSAIELKLRVFSFTVDACLLPTVRDCSLLLTLGAVRCSKKVSFRGDSPFFVFRTRSPMGETGCLARETFLVLCVALGSYVTLEGRPFLRTDDCFDSFWVLSVRANSSSMRTARSRFTFWW